MQRKSQVTDGIPDEVSDDHVEHIYEFILPAKQKPLRLDAYITQSIQHATRTRVQKAIDAGTVTVNNEVSRSNYKVRGGDVIRVVVMKPPPLKLIPQDIPLNIVYEDDQLIVVDKEAGLTVHPGLGNRSGTLVNAMLWHVGVREAIEVLRRSSNDDEETDVDENDDDDDDTDVGVLATDQELLSSSAVRPGVVHRLDKDTSGLIVLGKHYESTMRLANQFRDRTVDREYVALAWGVVKKDFQTIEGDLARSTRDRRLMSVTKRGGKTAATDVTVLERYDFATLIKCKLHTGRTHQIRVHCSSINHPIVGDINYGGRELAIKSVHTLYKVLAKKLLTTIDRQALHARTLGFNHPTTKERMYFTSKLPADIMAAIEMIRPTSSPPFYLE